MGDVARKGVAEITGRHDKARRAVGGAQGRSCDEIISRLSRNPRPIDRIDPGQGNVRLEGFVAEQALHNGLTVIKVALHRQAGDVGVRRRGHEASLNRAYTTIRKQNHDLDVLGAPKGFNRCAASIPGRGRDNGHGLAALGQSMVIKPGQELHGHVLEGERRAAIQLQQEAVGIQLHQRRDGGRVKARIGQAGHRQRLIRRQIIARKGLQNPGGDLGVGQVSKSGYLVGGKLRPVLRHIEPAIIGQALQQHVFETAGRRSAPGGDVDHGVFVFCPEAKRVAEA